jgi:hypothetical protein
VAPRQVLYEFQNWGVLAMRTTLLSALLLVIGTAAGGGLGSAKAAPAVGDFTLSCENGRVYPFRPRGVNPEGDLVTGYLVTRPGHAVHMRLIPLGLGYRYAGPGIWFDGVRDEAVLSFGKFQSVNCTVAH